MWDDFIEFYDRNSGNEEYFFGSIVVYKDEEDGNFQVIDGQQRLTSLLLLFAAMKCFLINSLNVIVDDAQKEKLENFIKQSIRTIDDTMYNIDNLSVSPPELKVKIKRTDEYDFDRVLNEAINCDARTTVPLKGDVKKNIAARYFRNREYFAAKLKSLFTENKKFTFQKAQEFKKFWKFLRTRISVVLIKTINFETAYSIFEVLNNRGLPLTNIDLFRSFLISRLGDGETKWDYLENSYNLTSDFLGRFIESKIGSQITRSYFNAVKKYYEDLLKKKNSPNKFYEEIEYNLRLFTMITDENIIQDIKIRYEIKFAKLLGYENYTINYLMALFRFFDYSGQENPELLTHLKSYVTMRLYLLMSPYKRLSAKPINTSIRHLNKKEYQKSQGCLRLNAKKNEELKSFINMDIYDSFTGRLLIARFLFESYLNLDDLSKEELIFKKSTLEHIIPQKPEKKSNWTKDFKLKFRNDYTYKLGNFTLLTHKMNARAKNYDFASKKREYKSTTLSITRELVELKKIDEQYIENRHKEMTQTVIKSIFGDSI